MFFFFFLAGTVNRANKDQKIIQSSHAKHITVERTSTSLSEWVIFIVDDLCADKTFRFLSVTTATVNHNTTWTKPGDGWEKRCSKSRDKLNTEHFLCTKNSPCSWEQIHQTRDFPFGEQWVNGRSSKVRLVWCCDTFEEKICRKVFESICLWLYSFWAVSEIKVTVCTNCCWPCIETTEHRDPAERWWDTMITVGLNYRVNLYPEC